MATESIENRPEEVPIDNEEANLLRGDELLEEGEWKKALHVYLKEDGKDRLINAALKFKQENKEEEYNMAIGYLNLLEQKNKRLKDS